MENKRIQSVFLGSIIFLLLTFSQGCMRYLTYDRSEVLLKGIDIDQTLKIAKIELKKQKFGSVLTIWAIRDQYLTPNQAERISNLYFKHIDSIEKKFDIWHLTWAITNMHRLGDNEIKYALKDAYEDARKRAEKVHNLADKMANGEKIYMGDAHSGGRAFAKRHIVIPGNEKYLQSFEEYRSK